MNEVGSNSLIFRLTSPTNDPIQSRLYLVCAHTLTELVTRDGDEKLPKHENI